MHRFNVRATQFVNKALGYNAVQFFSKLTAIQFIRATERVKRKVVEGGFGAQSIEHISSAAQSSG